MSLIPMAMPGLRVPSLSFTGFTEDPSNITNYSFASVDFGAAHATRRIIIACMWQGNSATRTISTATIGGVSATVHVGVSDTSPANDPGVAIISALVPTGTSGTVALNMSGGCLSMGIGVYRVINLRDSTPLDSATDTDDTLVMGVDTQAGGILIACSANVTGGTATTITGVTEEWDQDVGIQDSGGSHAPTATETNRAVTFDGANTDSAGCALSWR